MKTCTKFSIDVIVSPTGSAKLPTEPTRPVFGSARELPFTKFRAKSPRRRALLASAHCGRPRETSIPGKVVMVRATRAPDFSRKLSLVEEAAALEEAGAFLCGDLDVARRDQEDLVGDA